MYPDAGPSRLEPPHSTPKAGPSESGPPGRSASGRWDGPYDRDDRPNGSWSSDRPFRGGWGRGPRPNFRPGTGRSRTPSPPRRFDRDWERDRPYDNEWRGGPRAGPPRDAGFRDRERRWNDRRDDRFPSPPRSPPFPTRAPRSVGRTPPTYNARLPLAGARSVGQATPREDRDRAFPGRDIGRALDNADPGPGPSSMAFSTPNTSRPPRSIRGSSSPVETRRFRDMQEAPSTEPTSTVPLPADDDDLEEGEVLSPVKGTRDAEWGDRRDQYPPRDRGYDRWSAPNRNTNGYPPPRGSMSPRRRSRSPRKPDVEDRWERREDRGRSRSTPPPDRRRVVSDGDHRFMSVQRTNGYNVKLETDIPERPMTPMDPPPSKAETTAPVDVSTSLGLTMETSGASEPDRPDTPLDAPSLAETAPSTTAAEDTTVEQEQQASVETPHRPETPALPPHDLQPPQSALQDNRYTDVGLADLQVESAVVQSEASSDTVTAPELASSILDTRRSPSRPRKQSEVNAPDERQASFGNATQQPVLAAAVISSPEQLLVTTVPNASTPRREKQEVESQAPPHDEMDNHQRQASVLDDSLAQWQDTTAPAAVLQSHEAEGPALSTIDAEMTVPSPLPPSALDIGPATTTTAVTEAEVERKPVSTAPIHVTISETEAESKDSEGTRLSPVESSAQRRLPIDTTKRVTIAERRSVALPPTNGPLSSPFGQKFPRRDSMPTAGSNMDSTDAETDYGPRTADIEMQSDVSESEVMENRRMTLIARIKAEQRRKLPDLSEAVSIDNNARAPEDSSRVAVDLDSSAARDAMIRHHTRILMDSQRLVDRYVTQAVAREQVDLEAKIRYLQAEYKDIDREWRLHCDFLDQLMEMRGPPPADLYATPNALPLIPPGPNPIPTTPSEDLFGSRGNRRRGGVGDAVTTEAEFEAILAELKDTASKDPNFRASKTTAVVPDMLLDQERNLAYEDDNDLVSDPLAFYDYQGDSEPIWTDEERTTFSRRYLNYPKQFGKIADGLPNKSASDCVLFYYRTKKTVDYKGMLASRRGDKKKKGLPIKKSGKSSALLSNLDRQKPTVNAATTPGPRSAITPARNRDDTVKRGRQAKDTGTLTPTTEGLPGRRKKEDGDENGFESSANPSRAGSETPSVAKSKMRISIKGIKRPRVSSIPDPLVMSALPPEITPSIEVPPESTTPATPGELLPPVKRTNKKRRTVDPNDPGATTPAPEEKDSTKSNRRPVTNSYWSVDEKKKFRDLVVTHGNNPVAIAAELPGKSERQVFNFYEAHRDDMRLDDLAGGVSPAPRLAGHVPQPSPAFGPQNASTPHVRSIYDVYRENPEHRFAEPRLGMFPPTASANEPADPASNPPSRPGGMRISALLNDEPNGDAKPANPPVQATPDYGRQYDPTDAASDGTVSERDAEGGILRPSPRSMPPAPGPAAPYQTRPATIYDHHYRRPSETYDRRPEEHHQYHRSSTAQPQHDPPYYSAPPPRSASAAPAMGHPNGWDSRSAPPQAQYRAHPDYRDPREGYYPHGPPPIPHRSTYPSGQHAAPPGYSRQSDDWRYQSSPPKAGYNGPLPPIKAVPMPRQ